MKNQIYNEGDWFVVPLRNNGFATGIIVRCGDKTKIGLGYFFGPRITRVPDATLVDQMKASDAILVAWFGTLGIIQGVWPIIKNSHLFNKNDWPVPLFRRIDSVTPSKGRLIEYEQENPKYARPLHEIIKDANFLFGYPDEILYGSKAIEIKLNRLLK